MNIILLILLVAVICVPIAIGFVVRRGNDLEVKPPRRKKK